jgi:hypothetical protein
VIDAAVLDAMLAAGASAEVIVAAVKADAAKDEARREAKRANNAERQRRYKQRHGIGNASETDDNAGNALPVVTERCDPAPDKSPQTPKINPTPREHTHNAGARGAAAWKCPEGVDRQHWTDFLANRRTKRLGFTPTAYRGQLKQLEHLSDDDEWPPGRIVQFAAERGWGAFFDPRGRDSGRRNEQQRNGQGGSASGFGRTIDALGDFAREIDGGQRH